MGRVQQAEKNIFFGYISNFVILILGFLQRQIFIQVLGITLLGVKTLYTDILSMLSLAEFGIGTALNYSLYKPVANNDYEKIKSYMRLYKKAYLTIAGVIALIGLVLTPFLPYLIPPEDRGGISSANLMIYYLIFLFNTVSTYFVAYKYSLVNAQQRNYIQTNILTVTRIITVLAQIVILYVTRNFLVYLLTQAVIELLQKIIVSIYFNRLYPYLRDRNVERLSKEESDVVISKSKAWMLHKIGDVARLQTDSIIITYFINVDAVGFVGNYNYVITYASDFISLIFNSVISGFGNLVATESRQKQYSIFKVCRFFACWLYGYASVGFWLLLTPFVTGIWLDQSWELGSVIVALLLMDFYLKGGRIVLLNYKMAAGVFEQDRYLSLIQGVINLVISIVGIKLIGLPGVYVGTVISGILANLIRPVIIYRDCFSEKVRNYYKDSLKYICVILGIILLLTPVKTFVLVQVNLVTFLLMAVIVTAVYNLIFLFLFRKTEEFDYLWRLVKEKVEKIKRRGQRL